MATIINPSFESDFTGWTVVLASGDPNEATTPTSFMTYLPIEGEHFALLKTDGADSYTRVFQSFSAQPGDMITGWAFFVDGEQGIPIFIDSAQVLINDGVTTIATVFSASTDTTSTTPWTMWEYTFTEAGVFTLEIRVTNGLDSAVDSFAGLDAVQFISAPSRGVAFQA